MTATIIGGRKFSVRSVNSNINTIAVSGIVIDAAKNAPAPMTAKAPGAVPGHKRFQAPPSKQANSAPQVKPGVSRPPWAPARKLPHMAAIFNTNSVAAVVISR